MCTGGVCSVWHEPALPRVLSSRGGACPACPVMSGELLSFLSLNPLGSEVVKPKTVGHF